MLQCFVCSPIPKVSEKRGNQSEFHSKRYYHLQNRYFSTFFFLLRFSQTVHQSDKKLVWRKLLCQISLCRSLLISPLFNFSGNVDLTTRFGGASPSSGNNLLTTAVIGLFGLSLVYPVATIVIPWFNRQKSIGTYKIFILYS